MAGAAGASMLGTKLSDKLSERSGIEYSVILASGQERTIVQEFLENDRVVRIGDTCRLQMAADGRNRVLPAENLPDQIMAPKTTQFVWD
jgi:outer membrane lipoprotein SlyB